MSARSSRLPVVRVVRDLKLSMLLPPVGKRLQRMEASGVFARGRFFYVVFDNMTAVGRLPDDLRSLGAWLPTRARGPGYEDITFSERTHRFYLLVESVRRPDGTYGSIVEEFDSELQYRTRIPLEYTFAHQNKGFEGLACTTRNGREYLLALCEGNKCRGGPKGRKPGGGRIQVFQKGRGRWKRIDRVKLPRSLPFEDYAAVALRGNRIAIVSQASALLWVGRLRRQAWKTVDEGQLFDFPRANAGKALYCNVEGLSWVADDLLIAVSDRMKRGDQPGRCAATDESIHLIRLPRT